MIITRQAVTSSGRLVGTNKLYSGDSVLEIPAIVIPASSTNYNILAAIDVSQVVAFHMQANTALTVKTNSSSSPANTITLVADQPYQFVTGDYNTFLLTTDVTSLFVTNSSAATTFYLLAEFDATL